MLRVLSAQRALDLQVPSVETSPAGAEVLLDGLRLGETPVIREGVPPGLYALDVRLTLSDNTLARRTMDVFFW